jgi:hypothetical protein
LRTKLVRHYTRVVLAASDLRASAVRVSHGGVNVEVTLLRRSACRAAPDEDARILRNLKNAVPYPRSLRVGVDGTGQSLREFLATCPPQTLPGAEGRIVYRKSGSRVDETAPFRIRSKRWAVEYVNSGSFFKILVVKGKKGQPRPISRHRPASGKRVYHTGPGTFKLYISGSRDWTVRVRDGS